jgi:hypothetical protein
MNTTKAKIRYIVEEPHPDLGWEMSTGVTQEVDITYKPEEELWHVEGDGWIGRGWTLCQARLDWLTKRLTQDRDPTAEEQAALEAKWETEANWFYHCVKCTVCGWESRKKTHYSRIPKCTTCNAQTMMNTFAVHRKCLTWHQPGTDC